MNRMGKIPLWRGDLMGRGRRAVVRSGQGFEAVQPSVEVGALIAD